ncbi:NAD-dependent epimerase/dehydratase family protein [Aquabacterium sp. J223]|uniref:NAD-dependent epimerase/dehydratase family protein n=1 Tax=Aquabacterium sp. J223 TaxID=2898431 RepID=UPI0021AD7A77|nr:NAD(P)-dependent oxidoreductase [Aquabacterium sp. J223]UUX96835.1 NAD(P)-dependent oxidoreductase [Aquabacterium sp. J223]
MRVLVTGSTGFLGRHVVAALHDAGHEVRALVRASTTAAPVPAGTQRVVGDVAQGALPPGLFDGVDAVIHLAASLQGDAAQQHQVAVDGTRRLLAAMGPQRPHLLLASSFSVYDWSRVRDRVEESSPLLGEAAAREQDAYAQAKLAQEQLARTLCAERGQPLTVLRPAAIWGEADQGLHALGLVHPRLWAVIGPSRAPRLTHVRNCAHAFVAALDARARGQTFNVEDGFEVSAWRWAADLARLRARAPHRVAVPLPALSAAGTLAGPLLALAGRRVPGLLQPARLQARFGPARAGHDRLTAVLGWRPPLSRDAALRRSATQGVT